MDSLEISKIVGAGCVALLAYVGLTQVSYFLVSIEEPDAPAYSVELFEQEDSDGGADGPSLGQLLLTSKPEFGAETFRKKCASCHTAEKGGPNKIGPNLYGVMGRSIASEEGYSYSAALQEKGGALGQTGQTWVWDNMNAFLTKPNAWAKGTKMSFAGLRKADDRANLMAWLNQQSDASIGPPPPDE